jgi:hypothetical protein
MEQTYSTHSRNKKCVQTIVGKHWKDTMLWIYELGAICLGLCPIAVFCVDSDEPTGFIKSQAVLLPLCRSQGGEEYSSYSFLTLTLEGWVVSIMPWGKDCWCPLDRRLDGPQLIWTQRLDEESFVSARDWTLAVQSVVTLYWLNYHRSSTGSATALNKYQLQERHCIMC